MCVSDCASLSNIIENERMVLDPSREFIHVAAAERSEKRFGFSKFTKSSIFEWRRKLSPNENWITSKFKQTSRRPFLISCHSYIGNWPHNPNDLKHRRLRHHPAKTQTTTSRTQPSNGHGQRQGYGHGHGHGHFLSQKSQQSQSRKRDWVVQNHDQGLRTIFCWYFCCAADAARVASGTIREFVLCAPTSCIRRSSGRYGHNALSFYGCKRCE